MTPFEVKDFNGGMVDEVDGVQPRFSKRLRNLLLDANGKPYQRNGQVIWSTAQIPTGERVSAVKIIRDFLKFSQWTPFVYSHRKLWCGSAPLSTPETVGPSGWNEVLTPVDAGGTSQISIAPNVSASTKCKLQVYNSLLYASFSNRDAYSAMYQHPAPRRIWPYNVPGSGTYFQATVGCPPYNWGAPTFAGGAGGHSYLYYIVYVISFYVNNTQYQYRGTPGGPFSQSNSGSTLSQLKRPYNGTNTYNDPVDFTNMSIEIYRTTDGGAVPKLAHTIDISGSAGPFSWTDNVADGSLGQNLYTADGTASYDYAPNCKSYHIVNGVGHYGGFDFDASGGETICGFMGGLQSSPGVPESAPSAFLIPAPDHLTAIESVDIYPVYACRNSIWRAEGVIDAYGNGTVNLRPISERVGCVRQNAMVKTDQGLLFAADDGIYYTDGFQATKVTDHLNKYYRSWFNGFNESALDDIAAIYHPPTKKYFYASLQTDATSYASMPNTLHAGDLRHRTDEGGAAHSYLQGEANLTTNGLSFIPTALESFRDHIFVGDGQGYVTRMKVEPSDQAGADIVTSDIGIDGSVSQGSWANYPIVWDYISTVFDFGSRAVKKWVTRFLLTFKIRKNPAPNIFVQVNSINDDSFTSDSATDAKALTVIHETAVPANRREWTVKRAFPKGSIRCMTKQVQIKKASCILYASSVFGHQATVNAGAKTVALVSGNWPDVLGQNLQLSDSGYIANFLITAVSGATITVTDPGSALPSPGPWDWQIVGYPKDQAGGIESYAIGFDTLAPGMQTIVPANPAGGN